MDEINQMIQRRIISELQQVKREGVEDLLKWLDSTDFWEAPCSTRFHLAKPGGLAEHSLNVYLTLLHDVDQMGLEVSKDSIRIVGLCHDFCKIHFYGQEMRNVKENGAWVQKPFYTVQDQFCYGHGEKSALLVNKYIKLTATEFMAIRWHMGGFTPGIQDYSLSQALSGAFEKYPLALLLHIADMKATYILEKEKNNAE